jgi:LmbE family N-acetylglucosaminyl deacetylase
MKDAAPLPTRKDFLLACAAATLATAAIAAEADARKILIVVAHPDDEYAFAATTYRLVREQGWTADQVVITNGESGYRYSQLAEIFYGSVLTDETDARAHLPAIRKEEVKRAGRILGIRRHYFLDQRDLGFDTDAARADDHNWDAAKVRGFLADLIGRERYDVVFTLLPTEQTHGHHRAATILALEAVAGLPADRRPLVFGVEAQDRQEAAVAFAGLGGSAVTRTSRLEPVLTFDRRSSFGYRKALDYQIVVNWVIAEHKSQGLFQMDSGRHDLERFWLFEVSGGRAEERVEELRTEVLSDRAATVRERWLTPLAKL